MLKCVGRGPDPFHACKHDSVLENKHKPPFKHKLSFSGKCLDNVKYNRKVLALHAVLSGIFSFPYLLWYHLGCFVTFTWMYLYSEKPEIMQMRLQ